MTFYVFFELLHTFSQTLADTSQYHFRALTLGVLTKTGDAEPVLR